MARCWAAVFGVGGADAAVAAQECPAAGNPQANRGMRETFRTMDPPVLRGGGR